MEWFLIAWPTLLLLAIGVRMALRCSTRPRGPDTDDPIHDFLSICGWVLIAMALLPAIIAGIFTFIGLLIVAMAAVTLVEIVTQRRAAQRRSICRLLALFVERKQPFDTSVLLSTQRCGAALAARPPRCSTR